MNDQIEVTWWTRYVQWRRQKACAHHWHRLGVARRAACLEPDQWWWGCCKCPKKIATKYHNIVPSGHGGREAQEQDPLTYSYAPTRGEAE